VAPHPSALWNAARSWQRAGDLLRAAGLYQRYLREAPPGAPDRDAALADLEVLKPSLGRIAVVAPGATQIVVDGQPLVDDFAWVLPGAHVVEARFVAVTTTTTAEVAAGAIVSVALVAPAPAAPITPPSENAPRGGPPGGVAPNPAERDTRESSGWPAWTVLPFAGATLVAAGGLIASGVDTENLYKEFEASGKTSGYAYDNGRFAMHRTNVLVAVTSGIGAISLGVALFAIDWNGDAAGGHVVGVATPHGLDARGAF